MNSRLYVGQVVHHRHVPVEHRFVYPVQTWCVDVDELPELDRQVAGFGYNRRRPFSLHDADYLYGQGGIRQRLAGVLREHGLPDRPGRVLWLTVPRVFGYVFNPVSFYYCYADGDPAAPPRCVVAEVNNTFGERHPYVLSDPLAGAGPGAAGVRYRQPKRFHVSPFNDMSGFYELTFAPPGDRLSVEVSLWREHACVMTATLSGEGVPLTSAALWRTARRRPLAATLTFPRIVWQALQLAARRRLRVHPKPPPSDARTRVTARPGALTALCRRSVLSRLGRIDRGHLRLMLPDGSLVAAGDPSADAVEWRVRDWRVFRRLVLDGDIGLGEAYMAGEWDTPDPDRLLRLLIDNVDAVGFASRWTEALSRLTLRLRHALRVNTRSGSRQNIRAHYDLGNAFYRTFLDGDTWMYSSAIHAAPDEPLPEAQRRKIARVLELAAIGSEDHVLEIGCGWGGFAIEAVRRTGCRVTGITLSREQLALARERVAAAGLDTQIDLRLCDYRDMEGVYTRIVSIEMLEAVGHAFYGRFFQACDRVLAPGGRVVLQVICIPDERYAAYRRTPDWIQKHVFPGGALPSLGALVTAMGRSSRLGVERVENIGPHYALTLRAWRERFVAAGDELARLGVDETFRRMWIYYLAYCEAGFASRYITNLHLVLQRPGGG